VVKKLKLDHALAELIKTGQKTSTWRLFDDKDISVNDEVLLVDKVDPKRPDTWRVIGTARIDRVTERRLADITDNDLSEGEAFASRQDMMATYRRYYGPNVTWQTPVKMIHFEFTGDANREGNPDVLSSTEKLIIYADGGSRGNPGPSACGFVIYDEHHNPLVNRGAYLGVTTNNQAEYAALKQALEEAHSLGAREVQVYMDSMLVINQMRGIFKVKNRDLWPIHDAIKQLCAGFQKVTFTQVPRESNRIADAAVNAALDDHAQRAASTQNQRQV